MTVARSFRAAVERDRFFIRQIDAWLTFVC
jgi:hypothetical protein